MAGVADAVPTMALLQVEVLYHPIEVCRMVVSCSTTAAPRCSHMTLYKSWFWSHLQWEWVL